MSYFSIGQFRKRQRKQLIIRYTIILGLLSFLIIYNYALKNETQEVALVKGNKAEKKLAFTFNISWGEEKVYEILDVLEKEKIKATFFLSGEWAERHPQIVEKIAEQHEIGMLGYRYKNYLEQEIEQVRKDMFYARDVFKKLGFEHIRYIRPPSGYFNKEIVDLANNMGLEVIHWSINPSDWESPGIDAIVTEVQAAGNGDIVLFHASDAAKQTAAALQKIIPHFKKKNFTFISISEMKDRVEMKEELIE